MNKPLDSATLRRLAVEAEADPRSVEKRMRGIRVRGLSGHRIDRVLVANGFTPGAANQQENRP
jgi:hypothetical protein